MGDTAPPTVATIRVDVWVPGRSAGQQARDDGGYRVARLTRPDGGTRDFTCGYADAHYTVLESADGDREVDEVWACHTFDAAVLLAITRAMEAARDAGLHALTGTEPRGGQHRDTAAT